MQVYFGLGMVAWVIGFALERGFFGISREAVFLLVDLTLGADRATALLWIYPGIIAGLLQCGVLQLVINRTRAREADWYEAAAFGIGFGALKVALWGLLSLAGVLYLSLLWGTLEAPQQAFVGQQFGRNYGLIPLEVLDHGLTLVILVFTALLVLYGIQQRQARWFWLAVLYSSAIQSAAPWVADILGTRQAARPVDLAQYEALIGSFALVALLGIRALKPRFAEPKPYEPEEPREEQPELLEMIVSS